MFGATAITVVGGFLIFVSEDLRDWLFEEPSFCEVSVEIIEEAFDQAVVDHPDHTVQLEKLQKLYSDLARTEFEASEYFAARVQQFYLVKNIPVATVDSFYMISMAEFLTPRSEIEPETFSFTSDSEGNLTVTFWQYFTCFRNQKSKYESCHVFTKVVFDQLNHIIYFNDEIIEELVYTEDRLR